MKNIERLQTYLHILGHLFLSNLKYTIRVCHEKKSLGKRLQKNCLIFRRSKKEIENKLINFWASFYPFVSMGKKRVWVFVFIQWTSKWLNPSSLFFLWQLMRSEARLRAGRNRTISPWKNVNVYNFIKWIDFNRNIYF